MPLVPSPGPVPTAVRAVILVAAMMIAASLWTPASARDVAPTFLRQSDHRVASIGYRIALRGAALCPRSYPLTGLVLHHLGEYEVGDRPAFTKMFGMADGPVVQAIVEDSPAASAGFRVGDVVIAVGDAAIPRVIPADSAMSPADARPRIEAAERAIDMALLSGPRRVTIVRDGTQLALSLDPRPGCPGRVRLARSSQLNAFANRGYAIVTTRMLDFVRTDDELAIVMAHEMAHVILGHPETLREEGIPRGLLRHFGSNAARIRETEAAADRLGIKLAWAAGFDVSAAIPFWRRYMARRGPQIATTHPGLDTRLRIISQAIAELTPPATAAGATP